MSRTFTKLLFAVAMLFGLLNSAFADKYKATMEFSGIAKGSSENVDAVITQGEDGTYDISFFGFSANIMGLGDVENGSANITKLKGATDNGFKLASTSSSQIEIVGNSLDLKSFEATIDESGIGSGSFSGEISMGGYMTLPANCAFTLERVIENDTIVTQELEFDNVPFYNKVVDTSKKDDTTKTNNDVSAVGVRLFKKKASFSMADYEISVAELSLNQMMILENLEYAETTGDISHIFINGKTSMHIEEHKMDVPAEANIDITSDGKINGTINLTVDLFRFKYLITVVFGTQAEGVVVETKLLEYNKTNKVTVKSDETFALDSLIYINEEGILIENIRYSFVDQNMTLLIKDYEATAQELNPSLDPSFGKTTYKASKAEAYISVEGKTAYLKDVDIDLDITAVKAGNTEYSGNVTIAYGHLTIVDGGTTNNEFTDPEGPFQYGLIGGMLISMEVDTTGNDLDGYSANSEFKISGLYDHVDGEIKSVVLTDLEAAREAAIESIKAGNERCAVNVTATDNAGNSTIHIATCYITVAPVTIEEVVPTVSNIRVIADSLTGKATVKLEPLSIEYVAKNSSNELTKALESVTASILIGNETYEEPTSIELSAGKEDIRYVWVNPYTGEVNSISSSITVYSDNKSYTGISNVANKTVSVAYKNGELIVNGAKNDNVNVVSISGATVYSGKAGTINLHKGIYIVKVDGKAYKVVVK